jgi:hypothetical protein
VPVSLLKRDVNAATTATCDRLTRPSPLPRLDSETPRGPLRGCRGVLSVRHRLQAVTRFGSHDPYRPLRV